MEASIHNYMVSLLSGNILLHFLTSSDAAHSQFAVATNTITMTESRTVLVNSAFVEV